MIPAFGRESLADVRTLEILGTHDVKLTEAEQRATGMGAYRCGPPFRRTVAETPHHRNGPGHGGRCAGLADHDVRYRNQRTLGEDPELRHFSYASAINIRGQVTGYFFLPDTDRLHAFFWSP